MQSQNSDETKPKLSTTALGALFFVILSLVTLLIAGFLSSVLLATGAVVIGLAGTTTAVLSLRES